MTVAMAIAVTAKEISAVKTAHAKTVMVVALLLESVFILLCMIGSRLVANVSTLAVVALADS